MKLFKKAVSIVLLLSVVFTLSACSGGRLKKENIVKALENQDFEECDDYNDFYEQYSRKTKKQSVYVSLTDKKAQKTYDKIFNRVNRFPDADVTESVSGFYNGTDGYFYLLFFKFDDVKKAEKVYKKYVKAIEDADDGEEKDLIYSLSNTKKSTRYLVQNAYLEKDKLLIIYGNLKDTDIMEDLIEELKLPSDF